MPRIYDSNSGPFDYCIGCFPDEADAEELHKFAVPNTANDGRGCCFDHGSDHPPYDCDDYTCHDCGTTLTEEDD
jgi:hypothetical protein